MAGAKGYNVRSVFFLLEGKSLSDRKTLTKDSWVFTEFANGNHVALYIPQLLNLIHTYPALENRLTLVSKKATGKDY